ncbi:site-specific integrase [Solitalea lacus]|uniref:site-specific integrase n=1 Tax=Solitalea lacus TaxID=2911172 RepID=UPI001EDB2885|nr:site-specific integrase [Solitalea lacus]UKJ07800.1 site-specific integrase [Solitalea lacus]
MATVAIVLHTSKGLVNNFYPICLRVTQGSQRKYFAITSLLTNRGLDFKAKQEEWKPAEKEDEGLGRFKRSFKTYKEYNAILKEKLSEAKQILLNYESNGTAFSFIQFERDLKKQKPSQLLKDYYTHLIEELENNRKTGSAALYKENQSILLKYRPVAMLHDLNVKFLEGFENWLRFERKNKDTTISVKIRNLQRVINLAIEDGLYKKENYPFGEKKYSINKRLNHKTRKRSINLDIIKKIKDLKLKEGTGVHFAQQVFLFSFYMRGMNFVDMAFLEWSDIHNNEIHYTRRKTGQLFTIPLNQYALEIINYYESSQQTENYVFPILNDSIHITEKQKYTRKKTAIKKVNDNLKKIAGLIDEKGLNLTTYVSRHSYATNLKRSGVATSIISEALGHQTEYQTQTYLDEFEKGVISSMEARIFDF